MSDSSKSSTKVYWAIGHRRPGSQWVTVFGAALNHATPAVDPPAPTSGANLYSSQGKAQAAHDALTHPARRTRLPRSHPHRHTNVSGRCDTGTGQHRLEDDDGTHCPSAEHLSIRNTPTTNPTIPALSTSFTSTATRSAT